MKLLRILFFILITSPAPLDLFSQDAICGDSADGMANNGGRIRIIYPSAADQAAAGDAFNCITFNGINVNISPNTTNSGIFQMRSNNAGAGTFPAVIDGVVTLKLDGVIIGSCTYDNGVAVPNALPVEYVDINVKSSKEGNLISWITGVEINNHGFDIESSTDGRNFSTIKTVIGSGNSVTENQYSFLDEGPFTEEVTYYRLNQIDFDGESEYSKVFVARNEKKNASSPKIRYNLVPLGSDIEVLNVENAEFVLINSAGQSVSHGTLTNAYSTISTSELRQGIYYVVLGPKEVFKIIIM